MSVNSVQSHPSFKGSYYKLFNKWENPIKQAYLEVPISEIAKEAKDTVYLTVSGKGRFYHVCEKVDSTFNQTPIVLTGKEAKSYRFLTEQTAAKAHEALNYVMQSALEILKPGYEIITHKNLSEFIPHIQQGKSFEIQRVSPFTQILDLRRIRKKYHEPKQLPSHDAMVALNMEKLKHIDFSLKR